ncbi:hypothetical protein XA68_13472 [Ophiocordyceps unilateralis]|uniref:Major facilitator superfamily (MFS) profile domain-containing protein n=1 Tax=Ophiocordyceps unilateralis TaxID=268505 RepID=A0A2A9PBK8_OPHUN|nr:hypothetical protein XA68_13472 [Ophiocordyceps unilateralis]
MPEDYVCPLCMIDPKAKMDLAIQDEGALHHKTHSVTAQPMYAKDSGFGIIHDSRPESKNPTARDVPAWELDAENPYNWPAWKKGLVLFISALAVFNSTMGSAIPSIAITSIASEFGIDSAVQKALPISLFLLGYVFGPLVWGPLSEHMGRRQLTLATFALFMLFTMACAMAPAWWALLVFRTLAGIFGSSPFAVVAGILADMFGEPRTRGRAFALFTTAITFGPCLAPIVSALASSTIGWRWAFWVALIVAGITLWALYFLLPETLGHVLLARSRRRMPPNGAADMTDALPRHDPVNASPSVLAVVLSRPLRMLVCEPIVSASCAHLALSYAIFYVSFQAFPLVFQGLHGLPPGVAGLCFLPIGVGACLTLPVFWYWDVVVVRARTRGAPWAESDEYRRLPLVVLGGPLFALSLFWFGFSARRPVHFVVPLLAGVPFGAGFVFIYTALVNYLTDAYHVFAASAHAAASCSRSLFAVLLPLVSPLLFSRLGISGACALLGGLSTVMCLIPFVFIYKGPVLRRRSRFRRRLDPADGVPVFDQRLYSQEPGRPRYDKEAEVAGTVKAWGAENILGRGCDGKRQGSLTPTLQLRQSGSTYAKTTQMEMKFTELGHSRVREDSNQAGKD